ncbi:hypothetical protein [Pseudomonas syringae]|uniref:hypothetical protein n=1 Tax=Pseudomonas syringae TaxID=317 RepID=UPI0024E065FD|nr:hypothetical protein [Pseudomonas syringae]
MKASKPHNPCISGFLIMNFTALNPPDYNQPEISRPQLNSHATTANCAHRNRSPHQGPYF